MWPPSYLDPATVVWNCTLNSSIYRACLQKTFFPPLCTHPPPPPPGLGSRRQLDGAGNTAAVTAAPLVQSVRPFSVESGGLLFPSILKPFLTRSRGGDPSSQHLPAPAPQLGKPLT